MKKCLGILLTMAMMVATMVYTTVSAQAANEDLTEIKDIVQSIDIVFGGGDLYVETWDKTEMGFKVERGQNSNGFDYQCYVKDGVLYVDGSQKSGNTAKKGDNKVFLYIPSDKKFDDFILVNGNANAHIENVNCENLQIDVAIGTVTMVDFVAVDANITVGAGTINVEGKITGNADALCSAGTLNMTLSGAKSDHDYLINTTFGTIKIGNTTYGMMNEKKIVNNTSSKFDLECVAGQINCEFENEYEAAFEKILQAYV